MRRKLIIIIVIFLVFLTVYYMTERFDGVINKSQVVQSYDEKSKIYKATVTFEMFNFKKVSDLKVMVLYPDNTIEYHEVSSSGNNFTLNVTKDLADMSFSQSIYTAPEFLISWVVGNKKNIEYVYSGVEETELLLNN
ncbi:hypothetical protein N6H13_09270 [Paenibacillus sp. CC-CFT742]|nr:hypothetical protein [Paenibacillus sp. CC-CFT742]WJH30780.1 hypothetical protein N6H13_09270 [Paenibacillus sp. CC-CFT742]